MFFVGCLVKQQHIPAFPKARIPCTLKHEPAHLYTSGQTVHNVNNDNNNIYDLVLRKLTYILHDQMCVEYIIPVILLA